MPTATDTLCQRPRHTALLAFSFALVAGCTRDVTTARPGSLAETSPLPSTSAPVTPSAIPPPVASAVALPPSLATSAPARAEIRYLALGDSFTIGTGSRPDQAFPARLADLWRSRGRAVTLKNVAVNGFTTQDLLDLEISEVAPFSPTLVTLAIGANDLVHGSTLASYRAQVKRIFAALLAAHIPPASIVVLPQPDWALSKAAASFGEPGAIERKIEAFNAVLREEAESSGARYVDIFSLMREQARRGMIAGDGLHPAAAAHEAWAAELAARLDP